MGPDTHAKDMFSRFSLRSIRGLGPPLQAAGGRVTPFANPLPAGRTRALGLLLAFALALPAGRADAARAAQSASGLPDDVTPVYLIQGDGPTTPLSSDRVTTYGLVSGVQANGFYLQDPTGDGNPATSDGIFVYTSRRPRVDVGDCILVHAAEAVEYYQKTELTAPRRLVALENGVCGAAGLTPAPAPLPRPNVDPATLLERFEGMLVAIDGLEGVVQGPTKRFRSGDAEIALLAGNSLAQVAGGRVMRANPEDAAGLIFLGNGLGAQLPEVGWGDRVRLRAARPGAPALAVIDYSFGKYLLLPLPDQEIEILARRSQIGRGPEAPPLSDEGAFRVCSFNVLGLGRGFDQLPEKDAYESALRLRAAAIAEGLQNCEIIGLQETGKPDDAHNLAQALSQVSGLPYSAVAFVGPGTINPEFPLTNSLLVRDDRVTVRNAGNVQACTRFSFSVRLIPGQCAARLLPLFSRPPLVADLLVQGPWGEDYPLTVVVNHWRSKRGDESVNVVHRKLQAEHVASIVQSRLDADPNAHVVVLGDLNDFMESDPVLALQEGTQPALAHAFDALPAMDRYTYIFNGSSQVLDHLLLTQGMMADFAGIDIVHISADYPTTRSEGVPAFPSPYGSSDHDPLALTVRPGGSGWISGNAQFPRLRIELVDSQGGVTAQTHSDGLGSFRFFDLRPGAYGLRFGDSQPAMAAGQNVQVARGAATVVELAARLPHAPAAALFGLSFGFAGSDRAGRPDQ